MDWDGAWGVVMVIVMVLFWTLVIAAAVWLIRELTRARPHPAQGEDPRQILERRLADGSISVDEYRERRQELGRDG